MSSRSWQIPTQSKSKHGPPQANDAEDHDDPVFMWSISHETVSRGRAENRLVAMHADSESENYRHNSLRRLARPLPAHPTRYKVGAAFRWGRTVFGSIGGRQRNPGWYVE